MVQVRRDLQLTIPPPITSHATPSDLSPPQIYHPLSPPWISHSREIRLIVNAPQRDQASHYYTVTKCWWYGISFMGDANWKRDNSWQSLPVQLPTPHPPLTNACSGSIIWQMHSHLRGGERVISTQGKCRLPGQNGQALYRQKNAPLCLHLSSCTTCVSKIHSPSRRNKPMFPCPLKKKTL